MALARSELSSSLKGRLQGRTQFISISIFSLPIRLMQAVEDVEATDGSPWRTVDCLMSCQFQGSKTRGTAAMTKEVVRPSSLLQGHIVTAIRHCNTCQESLI